jgi:FkbM family methyltransferase
MKVCETLVYGHTMLFDADYAATTWAQQPTFESLLRPYLEACNGVFVDGGCNVGFHTLSAASLGLNVIAIDANFTNAAFAKMSVQRNGLEARVRVVNAALAAFSGVTTVDLSASDSVVGGAGDKVVAITLDELLADVHVGFMKLDLEGHEYSALLGARAVLARTHPVIVIEHASYMASDAVFELLEDLNYSYRVIGMNEQPFAGEVDKASRNVYMYECRSRKKA